MTFRYWLWTGLSVFILIGVVACGKSVETNNAPGTTAAVPLNGNTVCPAGSTLITTYGSPMCQGPNGITTPIYQNTLAGTQYGSDNYCYRNLTISNQSVFKSFLKEAMGMCDFAHSTGGMYDCNSWTNAQVKVDIVTTGSQMNFAVYAYPQLNAYYNYYYALPSASEFFLGMMGFPIYTQQYNTMSSNPITSGMSVFPINNSLGFEGRTTGPLYSLANRQLIQLQVAQGKVGDPYFTFVMSYAPVNSTQSTPFLSGTLVNKSIYGAYGCY